ncbi:IclR family transcriptional regulator [Natronococcus sp. A-GB7]|uniref:IclR family transcriptional regulator n=1 Tax=Natronococcus sp. A-GB7 TaxID=3037649 RepID=UPI00241F7865|nr:IclR family transcriptional regulator [Natronococcus sp. A-GB7]MDG5821404.1 IclR family transcriptional regulator [Natronococcus sp. A-GB7]
MSQRDSESRTLKTVSRLIKIIEVLARSGSIGVTTLARRLDLSKSTVHAYLKTLEENGFVVKGGEKYQLAHELMLLGESIRSQHILYQAGRGEIEELATETGQYAHLTIEENGKGINLYQARGETVAGYEYQSAKLHQPDHLHLTAAGKAILAFLPRDQVEVILNRHGLQRHTVNTITEREALFEELKTIRECGHAFNDEEEIDGFRAVGAPIRRPDGELLGALSVSGPTSVLAGDRFYEELPKAVTRTANEIEVSINMSNKYSTSSHRPGDR